MIKAAKKKKIMLTVNNRKGQGETETDNVLSFLFLLFFGVSVLFTALFAQ